MKSFDTTKGNPNKMANSGSPRKPGSGNRRPPGTGNRSSTTRRSGAPASAKPATALRAPTDDDGNEKLSADERARDRLSQPRAGAKRSPARSGSRPSGRVDPRKRGRQKPQKRSTSATAGIFGGAFVVLAVVAIVLISTLNTSKAVTGQPIAAAPVPAAVLSAVTHVPASSFTAAGVGGGQVGVSGVFASTPKQPLITEGGKPVLVYEGAEYCPYCAASRWPLIIALSRFGTFTGLKTIGSSPYDVYANTHTFTFASSHYTSKYLVFDPTEFESNVCAGKPVSGACPNDVYKTLQSANKRDASLFSTYDTLKYFPKAQTPGGIPFIDWGGLRVSSGAVYSPNVINAGTSTNSQGWHPLTWAQIVAALGIPSSGPGQAILGAATVYTAAICDMTHNSPASVCVAPAIKTAQAALASA
jgi:hypothetical protein